MDTPWSKLKIGAWLDPVARAAAAASLLVLTFGPLPFQPSATPAEAGDLAWGAVRSMYSGGNQLDTGLAASADNRLIVRTTKNGHIIVAGGTDDERLVRSTDGGKSWTVLDLAANIGTIVDMHPSPNYDVDTGILVLDSARLACLVRDFSTVTCSAAGGDAADVPRVLAVSPNFDATKNTGFVAMGVRSVNGYSLVYVNKWNGSTQAWSNDTGDTLNLWVNNTADTTDGIEFAGFAEAAGDAVIALAFSPKYSSDETLVAVLYDTSTGDIRSQRSQSNADFPDPTGAANLIVNVGAIAATRVVGSIFLSDNFDGTLANPRYFVGTAIDTDNNGTFDGGDVYEKSATTWTDTNAGGAGTTTPISSLVGRGEFTDATLVAGVSNNSRVLRSTDGADTWKAVDDIAEDAGAIGGGTANTSTQLALMGSTVYALTNGDQGGLHVSDNGGANWRDLNLTVNDHQENIVNIWQYATSSYVVVTNTGTANQNSVWIGSGGATANWSRVDRHSGAISAMGGPGFAADGTLYVLRGNVTAEQVIKCTGGGMVCKASDADATNRLMTALAVAGANTLFIGDVDGIVWRSDNGGAAWTKGTSDLGTAVLNLVLSPNFATDNTVLAAAVGSGGSYEVYLSSDGGTTFTQQGTSVGAWGTGVASSLLRTDGIIPADYVALAFHPSYATNKLIFAATLATGDSIYRYTVGGTAAWANTDPDALTVVANCTAIVDPDPHSALAFGKDGALYATSFADSDRISSTFYATTVVSPDNRGQWRCFDDSDAQILENSGGLAVWTTSGANKITIVDRVAGDDRMRSFTDTVEFLTAPVIAMPANNSTTPPSSGSEGQALTISWNLMSLVLAYQFQIATDANFDSVIVNTLGVGSAGATIFAGTLSNGATYYLRVRAQSEPTDFHWSPWSTPTKFTIGTVAEAQVPKASLPLDNSQLSGLSTQLSWNNPSGTTQVQVQVTPLNGDGPAINLIFGSTINSYDVPAPVFGTGPYVMLPGASYTWRVRTTNASTSVGETDASWGPWSTPRLFTTAPPNSGTIQLLAPINGESTTDTTPTLQWKDANAAMFYYEVQLSADPNFGEAGAVAPVQWQLRHGGTTTPPNSYTVPDSAALKKGTYYWRARHRLQATAKGSTETGVAFTPAQMFVVN